MPGTSQLSLSSCAQPQAERSSQQQSSCLFSRSLPQDSRLSQSLPRSPLQESPLSQSLSRSPLQESSLSQSLSQSLPQGSRLSQSLSLLSGILLQQASLPQQFPLFVIRPQPSFPQPPQQPRSKSKIIQFINLSLECLYSIINVYGIICRRFAKVQGYIISPPLSVR